MPTADERWEAEGVRDAMASLGLLATHGVAVSVETLALAIAQATVLLQPYTGVQTRPAMPVLQPAAMTHTA